MSDSLSTIGSIASFLSATTPNIPDGVSGNMVIIVDNNRQHVENFVGVSIGSNSIPDEYQPPIVNLSKADAIESSSNDSLKLGELSITESDSTMSAKAWRDLAESQLDAIGRKIEFRRSIS